MKKISLLILLSPLLFSSCVLFFMPSKQAITIKAPEKNSVVYVDKEEFGKGETIVKKIKKAGTKQVVIQTPGYKDVNYVLLPVKRPTAYWFLIALDVPTIWMYGGGLLIDPGLAKGVNYNPVQDFTKQYQVVKRTDNLKYIDLSAIRLDIKDKEKDIRFFYLNYTPNLYDEMERVEKENLSDLEKAAQKEKKKNGSKNKLVTEEDSKEIKYDDTKFSEKLYKTLKTSGFIDTVNKVFQDNNNTIGIEGSIKKIYSHNIDGVGRGTGRYYKIKVFMTWYIKNHYDEIIDSVEMIEYSGDFVSSWYTDESTYEKRVGDAVDNSYYRLMSDEKFQKYLKMETDFKFTEPMLAMKTPVKFVKSVEDAGDASVIVKNDKAHGSGFVVSPDGYIITNFHVIAAKYQNKFKPIKVILANGDELTAKIVRYNKSKDVALLKVEHTFDMSFKISNTKSFKNLLEVYTIGAPKSIELGQSVSLGLISNERKINNNNLIQVNMSVSPGNSGGPLFGKDGAIHGVIVSKLVGWATEGVTFAVPGYLINDYLNISYK